MQEVDEHRRDGVPARRSLKLRVPALPHHHVRRPRLLDLLDDDAAPVTLVVAPAGAGKTVLLSSWADQCTKPVAWLTPDSSDAGGVPFWRDVAASLDAIAPGAGEGAIGLLRRRAPIGDAAIRLLDDLEARLAAPSVLILDDLHMCEDEVIAASLALFLQHLPTQLRVVIGTRRTPAMPLERMRAQGRLTEIHFDLLRFSIEESGELLGLLCPTSSEDDVAGTVAATDGWAAGLQLAAIGIRAAASGSPAERSSRPTNDFVAEYLSREVLEAEKPELRQFLSDVAVVELLNAALGEAISERADARELLARAESRGLFVSRIDGNGWYELHPLVRGVLLAERERSDPVRLRHCRRRAARWLEDEREHAAALDQWLLAGEQREALRLLSATQVELYDAGREPIIRRVLHALTPAATADLSALVDLAWCHLLVDRATFLERVDEASWWVRHRGAAGGDEPSRVAILEATAAAVRGDWAAGASRARTSLGGIEEWWRDPIVRTGWSNVAREIALSERWDDTSDEVRELTVTLRHEPDQLLVLEATRALGEALAGRPVDALRIAAGVRASTTVANMTVSRAELALAEALAHRELGGPTDGAAELAALVDLAIEPLTYVRALAAVELVRAHLDGGDLVEAEAAFARAASLVEAEMPGVAGRSLLARVGTMLAAATGDPAGAGAWAERVVDPFWGPISAARAHLSAGRPVDAADAVELAVPRGPRHDVVVALLRARAVMSRDAAERWAGDAVELAVAAGMMQTVESEGELPADLIEHVSWRVPAPWMDRLRRASAARRQAVRSAPPRFTEPLTERERDVLRFLPSRLTIAEIADELYVSVNTLKFHLKLIYRKLGVNSRAEAAEFARRWPRAPGRDRA